MAQMPALGSLGWLDWTLLALLILSVVVGMIRGFVFECLSLVGWVVAWFASQWIAPEVAPYIPIGAKGGALNLAAALTLSFIATLIVWSLLAKLIRMALHATPLSFPDRLLGGGFGVLRGGVLLLAVAAIVALTPAAQSQPWRGSIGARWLGQTLHALKPLLPEPAARLIRA